jgi:hypothetical protein
VNAALRSEDRNKVKSIKNFIWLLMTGLRLSPKTESKVLYRGVREDLSAQYTEKRTITWYQISSCTSRLDILENPLFLGKTGDRTIFSIELASKTRARCIATFSSVQHENEVLLPPNTRLQVVRCGGLPCEHAPSTADASSPRQVVSQLQAASGLTMVQMKELDSLDPILAFDHPDPVLPRPPDAADAPDAITAATGASAATGNPVLPRPMRVGQELCTMGQDRRTPRAPAAHGRLSRCRQCNNGPPSMAASRAARMATSRAAASATRPAAHGRLVRCRHWTLVQQRPVAHCRLARCCQCNNCPPSMAASCAAATGRCATTARLAWPPRALPPVR